MNKNKCKNVENLLKFIVDSKQLPGFNMAIINGKDKYLCSYGSRQLVPEVLPVDINTRYDLASLSKVVSTTTCILKLLQDGKLDLNDKVTKYLDNCNYNDVTILQCLTHTSGLQPDIAGYKEMSHQEFMYNILNYTIEQQWIGKVRYSDINFILLGLIIEKITGSLKEYAEKEIFKPLGMNHTGYTPENKENIAATEVTKQRGVIVGEVHDGKGYRLNGVAGSAGLFSTIEDLCKFVEMLMDDDNPFLTKETRDMLKTCYADQGNDNRTLGWIISNDKSTMGFNYSSHTLYHTGFTGGSILVDLDNKLSLIILTNRVHPTRNNSVILGYRPVLNSIVYDCLKGE